MKAKRGGKVLVRFRLDDEAEEEGKDETEAEKEGKERSQID